MSVGAADFSHIVWRIFPHDPDLAWVLSHPGKIGVPKIRK
jgi:hypothetical protein